GALRAPFATQGRSHRGGAELKSGAASMGEGGRRSVVDIEVEVLAGDLLVGAVGDDLGQRLVQALAQGVVVLAHGDGGVGLGAGDVAEDPAAGLAVLVHPLVQGELVGDHPVQAAGGQVGVGLVHGGVELHVGAGPGV